VQLGQRKRGGDDGRKDAHNEGGACTETNMSTDWCVTNHRPHPLRNNRGRETIEKAEKGNHPEEKREESETREANASSLMSLP